MINVENNQECFVVLWRKQGLVVLEEDGNYRKLS